MTAGDSGTKYQASFYMPEITNNNAVAKNIVFAYNDAFGASRTATFAVASGTTLTTQNIADALKGTTVTGVTRTDAGTAAGKKTGTDE